MKAGEQVYRRLVPLYVLAALVIAVARAYGLDDGGAPGELAKLAPLAAPGGLAAAGDAGLTLSVLLRSLVPLSVGVALAWASAFHPGRRPPAWETALRGLALAAMAAYAGAVLLQTALTAGTAAKLLAYQSGKAPWALLLAAQSIHLLPRLLALALIFTAPLFWAVRALQVFSLPRCTFEAWAEVRRLVLPAVLLLAAAAVLEVFLAPRATAWLLIP